MLLLRRFARATLPRESRMSTPSDWYASTSFWTSFDTTWLAGESTTAIPAETALALGAPGTDAPDGEAADDAARRVPEPDAVQAEVA